MQERFDLEDARNGAVLKEFLPEIVAGVPEGIEPFDGRVPFVEGQIPVIEKIERVFEQDKRKIGLGKKGQISFGED